MATKPKAVPAPTHAIVRAKVNLPVDMSQAFADEVALVKNRITQPSGQWIKVELTKEFVLPDQRRLKQLDGIIVEFIAANNYYENDYVEGEHSSPVCFAQSFEPTGMVPSASIADPQNHDCTSCPMKAWKSHRNGRGGKACDDNRNYVIMEPQADGGTPKLYLVKVSKMAVKAFDGYINKIASDHVRPIRGVMTRISFDPTTKYPLQQFECLGLADMDQITAANSVLEEARRMLQIEPQKQSEAEEVKKPAAKKPAARR